MCNPALEKAVGKSAAEIIGKTDSEYYQDPTIGQALRDHDLRVIESGDVLTAEEIVKTPDGHRIFISNKAPYRTGSGDIIGIIDIIGISHDITERKRTEEALRESETRYRRLFENIQEMIAVYEVERDDHGRIVERRLRQRMADRSRC
jgi:PAS domain S-box-containing protein